jgi:hypothetical protein
MDAESQQIEDLKAEIARLKKENEILLASVTKLSGKK